ncbi:nucleoporin Nup37 [Culex pipiens pallens]|uniref:nucleoporin Nup37 n=1 Tax=Culex pipiens pallens TaxID=42434 RepID=UPI001953A4EF|nr:nucleoporin Nup37 [Culex pipiens pallens]
MDHSNSSPPTHTVSFPDKIVAFELSSYEWSQNLLCVALPDKLMLGLIRFPEETDSECLEWNQLKEVHHETRCHAVAFAPETSLAVLPKVVTLCTAGADFNLRIFNSDLEDNNTVQLLQGHRSYVNQVSWDHDGEYLASCGDDHMCIMWKRREDYGKGATFFFGSAVVSAKWHPDESGKVLIAEKSGIVHLYNVDSKLAILSVESSKNPLNYADWALNNSAFVVALAGGELVFWDLKKPSRPVENKRIHEDCGHIVKFSPHTESIVASVGRPRTTLKVIHAKNQIPQIEAKLSLYGGLCWHYQLPYVVAGQDRKLCFWKIAA